MHAILDYPFVINNLSEEDGSGFLIEFLDLPGCISDGDTLEEAIANGQDAVKAWIKAAQQEGRSIPKPSQAEKSNFTMRNLMQYKGYYGSILFSEEDSVFHGKVEFIRALVTYEANDEKSLEQAFHQAVEDYLQTFKT